MFNLILYWWVEERIDERAAARDSLRYSISELFGDKVRYIKYSTETGESNDEAVTEIKPYGEIEDENRVPPPLNHNYTPQDENGYSGLPFNPVG